MQRANLRLEICGGIAAGKTTLSKLLADLGFHPVNESFETNPFLHKFYTNPSLFSFETEISFLLQHYHQIKCELAQKRIACDYSFILDQAYADLTLRSDSEREVFSRVLAEVLKQLSSPDLIIYLKCHSEVLLKRIINRARPMEQTIELDYLTLLTNQLDRNISSSRNRIFIIESDKNDFAHNMDHREFVLESIKAELIRM